MTINWCPVCGGILQIIQYPVSGVMVQFWKCTEPDCPYETPVSVNSKASNESQDDD